MLPVRPGSKLEMGGPKFITGHWPLLKIYDCAQACEESVF